MDAARVIGNIADELFGWDAFSLDLYDAENGTIRTVLNIDTIKGEKQDVSSTYPDENPSGVARRIMTSGAELILKKDATVMLAGAIPLGDTGRGLRHRSSTFPFATRRG